MQKSVLFFLMITCGSLAAKAQLDKGTWIVGGSGSFSINRNKSLEMLRAKETIFDIQPDIGYFFMDKFAGGLRLQARFQKSVATDESLASKQQQIGFGPFLRYYLLPIGRQVNVLFDGSYQHLILKIGSITNGPPSMISFYTTHRNAFILAGGPVFYLNSVIGVETVIRYINSATAKFSGRNQSFQFAIGLQIHLEKDNQ